MTSWARVGIETSLRHNFDVFPGSDHWAQVDVWIPQLDPCPNPNAPGLAFLPYFLRLGAENALSAASTTSPITNWHWASISSNQASPGPSAGTTYTVGYHVHGGTFDWYIDGVLVLSEPRSGGGAFNFLTLNLSFFVCCCMAVYYTNIKVGTAQGAGDLFADDFSGGLGNWIPASLNSPVLATIVGSPAIIPCPSVTVSPVRGQPNSEITVTGSGFTPSSPLTFYWSAPTGPLLVEAPPVTTDGSGNFTTTFRVPYGAGTNANGDIGFVIDGDDVVGCFTFSVCGARKSDGITTLPNPIVATGGGTGGGEVLDYIFHDGAHWVLWADPSARTANGTFPPPANHTLNATRISADGSSVVDYPMDTNYKWNFNGGGDDDPGLGDFRLCVGVPKPSPGWTTHKWFDHWSKPIYDARFASDGTTLWVGIVTAESIQYPWLDNKDATQTNPGSLNQYVPISALTSGYTSFATNSGPGDYYLRHYTSTFGFLGFYQGTAFPTTDAGPQGMGVWAPPIVVMFSFDGSGFNRIGDIPAFYCPDTDGDNAQGNANTCILGCPPQDTFTAAQYSRLSLAASPNDPGVCHAVWAEGGDWGRVGDGDPCYVNPLTGNNRYTWDGYSANRDYRINYTTWDSIGKLTDTDLWHSHVDRTNWWFDYDQFGSILPTAYNVPDQADYAFSSLHDLRNDNVSGRVLLFLAWPQVFQNVSCPSGATSCGGVFVPGGGGLGPSPFAGPDVHGNPWLQNDVVLADTIHVYDITGGTPTLLQSITSDLYPNEAETEFFYPPTASETVPPTAPDCLYDRNGVNGGYDTGTGGFLSKPFGISLIYDDPLLGDTPVYLVSAIWTKRWVVIAGQSGYFQPGEAAPVLAFHRVPADMSDPFTFLDGTRQVNFTLLKADSGGIGYPMGPGDFFSDPRDIWEPLANLRTYGGGSNWFDRICLNEWAAFSTAWTPSHGNYAKGPVCPGFYYDPDADSITIATPDPADVDLFAVTTQFICRECRDCKCGRGIHIAHRF